MGFMFRFTIEGVEWILRFSPQVSIEDAEKQAIFMSLQQIGTRLTKFSHGSAFILFTKNFGAIIFEIERIPSFIITVSNIISEENWYNKESLFK